MRFKILVFLVLGALTLADVRFDFHYRVSGEAIPVELWGVPKADRALVDQEGGSARLMSPDQSRRVSVYKNFQRPGKVHAVRLSGELACRDIVSGGKPVKKGLFYLVQYDEKGKSLRTRRIAAALEGTRGWRGVRKVFALAKETKRLKVGAQLNRTLGELSLRDVRVTPVREVPGYVWVKGLMLSAWGLFFLLLVKDYLGMARPRTAWILGVCFAVVLIGTTIPDEARDWVLKFAGIEMTGGGLSSRGFGPLALDEWLHFAGFAVFGAVLVLLTPEIPLWLTCICLVICALGTEMVQVYVDSRTAKVFDGGINMAGWMIGVGIAGFRSVLLSGRRW